MDADHVDEPYLIDLLERTRKALCALTQVGEELCSEWVDGDAFADGVPGKVLRPFMEALAKAKAVLG